MPRNLDTPPPERLAINGPAGRLAATFEVPPGEPRGSVLHLHPLTLEGGSRLNNVVRHGALGALEAGCAALRIDLRGAGESGGAFDEGRGEVDDAEAAFRWLAERLPGRPRFVWGFSFGARVGLDLVMRCGGEAAGYLGVAWPTVFYDWPEEDRWPAHAAFLAGDRDEFVELRRMEPATRRGALLEVLPGAGHLFPGRLDAVRRFTARTLAGWLEQQEARSRTEGSTTSPPRSGPSPC